MRNDEDEFCHPQQKFARALEGRRGRGGGVWGFLNIRERESPHAARGENPLGGAAEAGGKSELLRLRAERTHVGIRLERRVSVPELRALALVVRKCRQRRPIGGAGRMERA